MSEGTESIKLRRQQTVVFSILMALVVYLTITYVVPFVMIWLRNARERKETMARIEGKQKRCEMLASQGKLGTMTKKEKQPQNGEGTKRFDLKWEEERIKEHTDAVVGEGEQARNTMKTPTKKNEKFTLSNVGSGSKSVVNVTSDANSSDRSSSSGNSSQRRDAATLWREVCHFHPYYYASSNPWMTPPPTALSSILTVALGRERSLRLSQDMEYAAAVEADLQRQETLVAALKLEQEQESKQRMKAETWQQLEADEPPEGEGIITIKFQYKLEGHDTAEHPLLTARITRRFLSTDSCSKVLSFVESHPLCPLNYTSLDISSSFPRINFSRSSLVDLGSSGDLTLAELQLTFKCVLYVHIQM